MTRNVAGQIAGNAQMNSATTGGPITTGVSVNVTLDGGGQNPGTGILTHKGNGQWQYAPTQAETNALLCAYQFVAAGAADVVINVPTFTPAQLSGMQAASGPNVITVSKIFELALKRINVIPAGGSMDAFDGQDAMFYANNWIDSLAIQNLTIPFTLRTTFTMIAGQQDYMVGLGGDINIPRPSKIDHVNYIDASLQPPIERELAYLTDDAWAAIPIKSLTSSLPSFYYWNPTYNAGLGTLSFWLVPTSPVLTGVLYAGSSVPQFQNLNDALILPPGWQWFVQENLAVFFAGIFRENLPVDPNLAKSASDAMASIKRANTRPLEMSLDPALTHDAPRSNIYTGR